MATSIGTASASTFGSIFGHLAQVHVAASPRRAAAQAVSSIQTTAASTQTAAGSPQPAGAPTQPAGARTQPAGARTQPAGARTQTPAHRPVAVPQRPGVLRTVPAHPAPAAPPTAPTTPYLIYDSVSPGSIPANQRVATYVNGNFAAQASAVAGRGKVLWIDTNGSDPAAFALDVEPGDATPAIAAQWVKQRIADWPWTTAIVYTMRDEWPSVKDAIATLPPQVQTHVRYWIADPTGVPHMVPGANATQWYWGTNYDITTADPGFQE